MLKKGGENKLLRQELEQRELEIESLKKQIETYQNLLKANGLELPSTLEEKEETKDGVEKTQFTLDSMEAELVKFRAALGAAPPGVRVEAVDLRYCVRVRAGDRPATTIGGAALKLLARPCARAAATEKVILDGVSLALEPGTLTLVLGPPGAGKTTLLRALAGRLPPGARGAGEVTGEVLFNGQSVASGAFVPEKVAAYVVQRDVHCPVLTVRETLAFAFACLSAGTHSLEAPGEDAAEIARADAELRKVRNVMRIFGLERCADTLVGNEALRGVSGGERKRVTTAEMLMGTATVLCGDEISTGLDAAATRDICRAMRIASRVMGSTVAVSLLQPPPEVVALFDRLVLLAEGGRVAYAGPLRRPTPPPGGAAAPALAPPLLPPAEEHFAALGFRRPPGKDQADYLVELVGPGGAEAFRDPEAPGTVRTAADFHQAFLDSEHHKATLAALLEASPPAAWGARQTRRYALGLRPALVACLRRQAKLFRRDPIFLRSQVGQAVAMGLVAGSLFFDLGLTEATAKLGVFFFALMSQALSGMAAVPGAFQQKAVFLKQRDARFHPTAAYVIGYTGATAPLNALKSFVMSTLLYWMCGLSDANGGGRYFVFLLLLFQMSMGFQQFLQLLVALFRNEQDATAVAGVATVTLVLFSGFIIRKSSIPDWWIWIFWANPLSWGIRALSINEFTSPKYDANDYGSKVLASFDFPDGYGWVWACAGFLAATFLLHLGLTALACHFLGGGGAAGGGAGAAAAAAAQEEAPPPAGGVGEEAPAAAAAAAARPGGGGKGGEEEAKEDPQRVLERLLAPGGALAVPPVALSFHDLWYTVPLGGGARGGGGGDTLDLLQGVSGACLPGRMTALMGSSGAGKTTLLDVAAGRKTGGEVRGEVRVNGFPKDQRTFQRLMGYCEQLDVHSPTLTVRESLAFSAALRLPAAVPAADRARLVDALLALLELDGPLREALVGDPATAPAHALSFEQRKRLTLGVELAANPAVLFLDEPTSGLDARAAARVVGALRRIVRATRKTVICTIHQPSAAVFSCFDDLLLLKRGGRVVFHGDLGGPGAPRLTAHLGALPGAPAPAPDANPATWMLEVIGAGTASAGGAGTAAAAAAADPADFYARSPLGRANAERLAALAVPEEGAAPVTFATEYAAGLGAQTKELMRQACVRYWRSPNYNLQRLGVSVAVAVLFGSNFADADVAGSQVAIVSGIGLLFLTTIFVGVVYINGVIPVLSSERAVFYREQAAGAYRAFPYTLAWGICEIPYLLVCTLVFSSIFYFLVGFEAVAGKFFLYYVYFFLYVTYATFLGQFLAAVLPNAQTASLVASALTSVYVLFTGFLIQPHLIPDGWLFLYYVNPMHYALEGIVVTQYRGMDDPVTVFDESSGSTLTTTVEQFALSYFGGKYEYSNRYLDFGILLAFIICIRFSTMLAFKFVRHTKR